jgi:carbon-monoxide dehydrogenase medium subunit
VILRGRSGERTVAAAGFATGIYETARAPDEIVAAVRIPRLSEAACWGYRKFCRKAGEFAHSIAAAVRDPARGYARVVLGAAGGPPLTLARASACLRAGDARGCAEAIAADLGEREFDDFQASLHAAMAARALRQALS